MFRLRWRAISKLNNTVEAKVEKLICRAVALLCDVNPGPKQLIPLYLWSVRAFKLIRHYFVFLWYLLIYLSRYLDQETTK